MHKLNPAQARAFLMLHPAVYRVLFAEEAGTLDRTQAMDVLCMDKETYLTLRAEADAEAAALEKSLRG